MNLNLLQKEFTVHTDPYPHIVIEEALPWESKSGWANETAENKAWRDGTG